MPARIEDYALIGDCETAALVDKNGSIDWLCWPDFSSEACFAALLGTEENGYWKISPAKGKWKTTRRYRPHTLILDTTFETKDGSFRIIDFMPVRQRNSHIVRIVEGIRGKVPVRMEMALRFDYGLTVPWVTRIPGGVRAIAGPNLATLRASVPMNGENMKTVADFTVGKGDRVTFSLTYGLSYKRNPAKIDPVQTLNEADTLWRHWSARLKYKGEYRDVIERSLITLRALIYRPTGGIVAAVTTSLPECIGGVRNWDYRYCWLRDSAFTLYALIESGFLVEADDWRGWLLRAAAGSPDELQIMYGIAGERRLYEYAAFWLPGYEGAGPVRIGNAAAGQVQLDVYGEVLDTFYAGRKAGLAAASPSWALECALVQHLETIWTEPDNGLWEVRGGVRHFTHSKVMAWVAFDRAVRSAEEFGLDAPLERWRAIRDRIHDEVCRKGFDAERNCFVQSYGSENLDASLLLIPLVGFLPPADFRVQGTLKAIESGLLRDGFVLRYDTREGVDGLPPKEGAFVACSFWLVDNYVLQGRYDDARALFVRLLALRNDVGLLAEEYDVYAGRQVGNFPQAFSHLALVNSAWNLTSALGPAQKRSEGCEAQSS